MFTFDGVNEYIYWQRLYKEFWEVAPLYVKKEFFVMSPLKRWN